MKDRKLQVFVSSTYLDLIPERQAAVEAILMAGHIPAGMELFASEDKTQMEVIKKWIDESDVYLLILGGRYGSIDKESGKSYTHLEYEYAIERGKAFFAVVVTDEAHERRLMEHGSKVAEQKNPQNLEDFKVLVRSKLVRHWDDVKDIKLSIIQTLSLFANREELVGWVRADQKADMGLIAEEIAKLSNENELLRAKISTFEDKSAVLNLYNGLSFDQMASFLHEITLIEDEESSYSLLDFLRLDCERFGNEVFAGSLDGMEDYAAGKLAKFGIVKSRVENGDSFISFTREGHLFYLHLLVRK